MARDVNGMKVVAALLREHGFVSADETWVHGMWTPDKWGACLGAKLRGRKLVRMTHGSLSPAYLEGSGKWKKRLVRPIERFLFALSDRLVCTGPWEVAWARRWGYRGRVEIIDLKPFFALDKAGSSPLRAKGERLHVLYLGRRHALKGLTYLERAVEGLSGVELREVTDHFGAALEADWAWCDVLCLPTLSENFGLVVAEALSRGKRAITTDGAPAWSPEEWAKGGVAAKGAESLVYLKGFCEGSEEERVKLLRAALARFL